MKILKSNKNVLLLLTENEKVEDNLLKPNSVDASFEKHVPQFKIDGNTIEVFVNHVMEDDHYIEWILVDYGDRQIIKHFSPNDKPSIIVEYQDNIKAYSYCNKHSLWSSNINENY